MGVEEIGVAPRVGVPMGEPATDGDLQFPNQLELEASAEEGGGVRGESWSVVLWPNWEGGLRRSGAAARADGWELQLASALGGR